MHKAKTLGLKLYIGAIILAALFMIGGYVSIKTTNPALGADIGGGIAVFFGGFIAVIATLYALTHLLVRYFIRKAKNAKNQIR